MSPRSKYSFTKMLEIVKLPGTVKISEMVKMYEILKFEETIICDLIATSLNLQSSNLLN